MNIRKIINSKCPYCKKRGIQFYKTSYKYNPILTCRFCGKKFKVNRVLSITAIILLAVLVGVVSRKVEEFYPNIPMWSPYCIMILLWLVFEYFAPLDECDDNDTIDK